MLDRRLAASRPVRDDATEAGGSGSADPRHRFAGDRPAGEPIAHRNGAAVTTGRFAAHVAELAGRLPRTGEVINLCEDRYLFTVAYAAALSIGATTLLPSGRNAAAVRDLTGAHGDAPAVGDRLDTLVEIAVGEPPAGDADPAALSFAAPQAAAVLHTSGSTGTPTAHAKRWGSLVQGARMAAQRFQPKPGSTLVATVPPQHMYGLEASIMLALQGGCVMAAGQPMFPEDVRRALESAPEPRVLVTTPVHLRVFMESSVAFPAVDWVLSSTAPLDAKLAEGSEKRFGAPVYEIYGSTETGAMATRRTARESRWWPIPGFSFDNDGERWWARAPHLDAPMPLGDLLEMGDDGSFALAGRRAELIKIAGKRASLGELNRRLLAVDGVVDGTFYAADAGDAGTVRRLAAFVVAPERDEREILDALRREIDPVFLPRPLIRLAALPRNEAGKLPRRELDALAREYLGGR